MSYQKPCKQEKSEVKYQVLSNKQTKKNNLGDYIHWSQLCKKWKKWNIDVYKNID